MVKIWSFCKFLRHMATDLYENGLGYPGAIMEYVLNNNQGMKRKVMS